MRSDITDDDGLYLDDLAVGQRFETATCTVSAAQIQAFAREFDPQPFHLDDEAARASLFEGLAASGWHTAAITMRLFRQPAKMAGRGRHERSSHHWQA